MAIAVPTPAARFGFSFFLQTPKLWAIDPRRPPRCAPRCQRNHHERQREPSRQLPQVPSPVETALATQQGAYAGRACERKRQHNDVHHLRRFAKQIKARNELVEECENR